MDNTPADPSIESDQIIESSSNLTSDRDLMHLLRRCLIGVSISDWKHFRTMPLFSVLDDLLDTSIEINLPLKDYSTASTSHPDSVIEQGETWVNHISFDPLINIKRKNTLKSWLTAICYSQHMSLQPRMILFWEDFFGIDPRNITIANHIYEFHMTLINNNLGSFKEMLLQQFTGVALQEHYKKSKNNSETQSRFFAKSILDNFLFGEPCEKFISSDRIKRFTKMMNKWTVIYDNLLVSIQETRSKNKFDSIKKIDDVLLLPTLDKAVIREYFRELDGFLHKLMQNPQVALHICSKIFKWFVRDFISNEDKTNIIEPMITSFRKNNYDIRAVLKSLLLNPFFLSLKYQTTMIKNPVDFIFGICRNLEIVKIDYPFVAANYPLWEWMHVKVESMNKKRGALVYQEHTGNQEGVEYHHRWINPAIAMERNMVALHLIESGIYLGNKVYKINIADFIQRIPDVVNLDHFIETVLLVFYQGPVSEDVRSDLKNLILSKYNIDNSSWKDLLADMYKIPVTADSQQTLHPILKDLIKNLLYMPQYQFL